MENPIKDASTSITDRAFRDGFVGPALCPVCEEGHLLGMVDRVTQPAGDVDLLSLQCVNGCGSNQADSFCMKMNKINYQQVKNELPPDQVPGS